MFVESAVHRLILGLAVVTALSFLCYASAIHAQQAETSSPAPDDAFSSPSTGGDETPKELSEEEQELLDIWNEYQRLIDEEQWDAALDIAAHLYDVADFTLQRDDPRLGALAVNYANLLNQQGHERQALEVMQRARQRYESLYAPDSPEMINLLMAEGDLLANPYDVRPQKRKYQEALDIVGEHSGYQSVEYAELSMRASIKLMELSRSIEGERYLKNALRIFKAEFGENDERTGRANFYIGRLVYGKGRRAAAERYMKQALTGFDIATESGRQWAMIARRGLISIYQDARRTHLITEQLQEIGRIWELASPDDPAPVLLIRQRPSFPDEMLERGQESTLLFVVTVDEQGNVQSPKLTRLDGDEAFIEPALKALMSFRYIPRFVDGAPVTVENVEAVIEFKLR